MTASHDDPFQIVEHGDCLILPTVAIDGSISDNCFTVARPAPGGGWNLGPLFGSVADARDWLDRPDLWDEDYAEGDWVDFHEELGLPAGARGFGEP
jgi:hypothetical protein